MMGLTFLGQDNYDNDVFGNEGERTLARDDGETLTVMKPSGALQVVDVEEQEVDSIRMRRDARPNTYHPATNWLSKARRIFMDTSQSQPALEALKEGEKLLGKTSVQIVKRRDLEAENARIGEEKAFSATMHEEWVILLDEEIWLLRAERMNLRNEILKQKSNRKNKQLDSPKADQPSQSEGANRKVQLHGSGSSSAGAQPSSPSRGLHPPAKADNPFSPPPSPFHHPPRPNGTYPAGGTGSPVNGVRPKETQASQGPLGQAAKKVMQARHRRRCTIGSLSDLDQQLGEDAGGVQTAMAAAEAATTGGKRMVRVWEGMKRMMPNVPEEQHPQLEALLADPIVELPSAMVQNGEDAHAPGHEHVAPTPLADANDPGAENAELPEGPALRQLLLQGRISPKLRGRAWVAVSAPDDLEEDSFNRTNYHHLLQQPSSYVKEIERDVNRTFPTHCMFKEEQGAGQKALFNVIKAYSVLDKEVGYCQGMGFITATLLMQMGEEDAFCCLLHLMLKCGLRGVFLPDMIQLQKKTNQLGQLLESGLDPSLHDLFQEKDIKPVMYAADWFLTLFARTMPPYLVSRVFDIIFVEATTAIIFKLAIVLLQISRRQLHHCPEMEYCMYFLRYELPSQLKSRPEADLDEIVAKAMRVSLPFERFLQIEAEYEFLAGEARASAREMEAVAAANAAAALSWERSRKDMHTALHAYAEVKREGRALKAQLKSQIRRLRTELRTKGRLAATGGSEDEAAKRVSTLRLKDEPGEEPLEAGGTGVGVKTVLAAPGSELMESVAQAKRLLVLYEAYKRKVKFGGRADTAVQCLRFLDENLHRMVEVRSSLHDAESSLEKLVPDGKELQPSDMVVLEEVDVPESSIGHSSSLNHRADTKGSRQQNK